MPCSCKKCNEQCSCYINGLTCTDACKCGDCSSIDYDGNDDIDNICDYTDDDEYSDDGELKMMMLMKTMMINDNVINNMLLLGQFIINNDCIKPVQ